MPRLGDSYAVDWLQNLRCLVATTSGNSAKGFQHQSVRNVYGEFAHVIRRRDFNDVHSDNVVFPGELPNDSKNVTRCNSTWLWSPGSWCERWVEAVNVNRDVEVVGR